MKLLIALILCAVVYDYTERAWEHSDQRDDSRSTITLPQASEQPIRAYSDLVWTRGDVQ